MTLSLLALFILPMAFKMVLDPKGTREFVKEFENSAGVQWSMFLITMLFALLIVTTSPVSFKWDTDSILSWIAVLTAIKGVSILVPSFVTWRARMMTESRIPVFGFLSLLLALVLVYLDTQVL